MKKLFWAAPLLAIMAISCVSTTVITSTPPGALVFINDIEVGSTPYTHQDRKLSFSKTPVTLVKAGHTKRETHLRKNQQFVPQNLLGTPLVFPLLYLWSYSDTTHIIMAANELRQDVVNEEDLLNSDPRWLREELRQLEAAYKAKTIDKKPYKVKRRQLREYLKIAEKDAAKGKR
jgi:hypothetical protein